MTDSRQVQRAEKQRQLKEQERKEKRRQRIARGADHDLWPNEPGAPTSYQIVAKQPKDNYP